MLTHRLTGEDREVDILISTTVGEHIVNVALECIEHGRPADVTWVEQQQCKHEHLPTDKLILVSLAGFTAQAKTLAERLGIDSYSPEEARALDWTQVVGLEELFVARYDFTPITQWIVVETRSGPQRFEAGPTTVLQRKDSVATATLGDLVMVVLSQHAFGGAAMTKIGSTASATVEFDFNLDHPTFALDTSGNEHLILNVHAKVKATRKASGIRLKSLEWKGTPAAFGSAQTVLGDTSLSFVESGPGELSARIVVDGRDLVLHKADESEGGSFTAG
ncbi:MAG: hypothetical protein NFW16_02560 [Candidatus Accumulibacter sp.]|uniref:hypothetical protein n=1 Tax=Accumulibacter sp. TaxID=2053492 RepID=UPI00258E2943|nr:hypothetical protein [Accumulibacter sp.]MCM8620628.1 hypothetical protein [Accumulibacter sp.]